MSALPLTVIYNPIAVGSEGRGFLNVDRSEFAIAFLDPLDCAKNVENAEAEGIVRKAMAHISPNHTINHLARIMGGSLRLDEYHEVVGGANKRTQKLIDDTEALTDDQRTSVVRTFVEEGQGLLTKMGRIMLSAAKGSLERDYKELEEKRERAQGWVDRPYAGEREDARKSSIAELAHAERLLQGHPESPTYLQKRAEMEAFVKEAYDDLPQYMRDHIARAKPPVIINDRLSSRANKMGLMVGDGNYIMLDGMMIDKNPELAKKVFKEEMLHLLDIRMGYTDRPEWQEAARAQLENMQPETTALIFAATDHVKAAYGKGYDTFYRQSLELLVDYFHVRDHLHEQRELKGLEPSVEAVRSEMARLFPQLHEQCESFEIELSRGPARTWARRPEPE